MLSWFTYYMVSTIYFAVYNCFTFSKKVKSIKVQVTCTEDLVWGQMIIALSRFSNLFTYLFLYQLFWTKACPEGMCTNGTYRSHEKTGKQKKSCNKLTTITAMNLTFSLFSFQRDRKFKYKKSQISIWKPRWKTFKMITRWCYHAKTVVDALI